MSTRLITQREREGIAKVGFGDLAAPSTHRIIGADSVAIILSSQNRVNSLTREQVGQIFSGALTDWSQVSGAERGPIKVFVSDEYPHILFALREIMQDSGAVVHKAPAVQPRKGNEVSDIVSQDRLAVGAVSVPYLGAAKSVAIVGRNGVAYHPNLINLRAGTYPLSRPLYLYTPATSEGSLSGEFISFALSAEGQEIVRKAGFTKASDVAQAR
jgi:phosphate transport system substrate-binding protein